MQEIAIKSIEKIIKSRLIYGGFIILYSINFYEFSLVIQFFAAYFVESLNFISQRQLRT